MSLDVPVDSGLLLNRMAWSTLAWLGDSARQLLRPGKIPDLEAFKIQTLAFHLRD